MSATVETVTRDVLRGRRAALLARAGTTWAELERRASNYALTDDERGIYDSIRGIDWMLARR